MDIERARGFIIEQMIKTPLTTTKEIEYLDFVSCKGNISKNKGSVQCDVKKHGSLFKINVDSGKKLITVKTMKEKEEFKPVKYSSKKRSSELYEEEF